MWILRLKNKIRLLIANTNTPRDTHGRAQAVGITMIHHHHSFIIIHTKACPQFFLKKHLNPMMLDSMGMQFIACRPPASLLLPDRGNRDRAKVQAAHAAAPARS